MSLPKVPPHILGRIAVYERRASRARPLFNPPRDGQFSLPTLAEIEQALDSPALSEDERERVRAWLASGPHDESA